MKKSIFPIIAVLLFAGMFFVGCPSSSSNTSGGGIKSEVEKGGYLLGKAFFYEQFSRSSDYIPEPTTDDDGFGGGTGGGTGEEKDVWTEEKTKIESRIPNTRNTTETKEYLSFYDKNVAVLGNASRTVSVTEYVDVYEVQDFLNGSPYGTPTKVTEVVDSGSPNYGEFSYEPKYVGFYTVDKDYKITFEFTSSIKKDYSELDYWFGAEKPNKTNRGLYDSSLRAQDAYYLAKNSKLDFTYKTADTRSGLNGRRDWTQTSVYTWKEIPQEPEMAGPSYFPERRLAFANKKLVFKYNDGTCDFIKFYLDDKISTGSLIFSTDASGKEYYEEPLDDQEKDFADVEEKVYYGMLDDKFIKGVNSYYSSPYEYTIEEIDTNMPKIKFTNGYNIYPVDAIYGEHFDSYPIIYNTDSSANNTFDTGKAWCYQNAIYASDDMSVVLSFEKAADTSDSISYKNILVINGEKLTVTSLLPHKFVANGSQYTVTWNPANNGQTITITDSSDNSYDLCFLHRTNYDAQISSQNDMKLVYIYARYMSDDISSFYVGEINNNTNTVTFNLPNEDVARALFINWWVNSSKITLSCDDYVFEESYKSDYSREPYVPETPNEGICQPSTSVGLAGSAYRMAMGGSTLNVSSSIQNYIYSNPALKQQYEQALINHDYSETSRIEEEAGNALGGFEFIYGEQPIDFSSNNKKIKLSTKISSGTLEREYTVVVNIYS